MSESEDSTADLETQRLEKQREFLLGSLRDLEKEHDAGDIADDDYTQLKEDYTTRAAEVLKALEAQASADSDSAADIEPLESEDEDEESDEGSEDEEEDDDGYLDAERPRRRYFTTFTVVMLIALLAGIGLLLFTGKNGGGTAQKTPPTTALSLTGTPEERLARAHDLEASDPLSAIKLYDSVLKNDPKNVEAMTYRGWLLVQAQLVDQGMASINQAIATDPNYAPPHFFRGYVIYSFQNDPAGAIPEFEAFLAHSPPGAEADAVKGVLDHARQDAAAAATSTTAAPAGQTPPPG